MRSRARVQLVGYGALASVLVAALVAVLVLGRFDASLVLLLAALAVSGLIALQVVAAAHRRLQARTLERLRSALARGDVAELTVLLRDLEDFYRPMSPAEAPPALRQLRAEVERLTASPMPRAAWPHGPRIRTDC